VGADARHRCGRGASHARAEGDEPASDGLPQPPLWLSGVPTFAQCFVQHTPFCLKSFLPMQAFKIGRVHLLCLLVCKPGSVQAAIFRFLELILRGEVV
jgi:hypothetical protein